MESAQQPAKKPNRSIGPLRKNFEAHGRMARPRIAAPRFFGPIAFDLHGQKYERQLGGYWYHRAQRRVPTGKKDEQGKPTFKLANVELRRVRDVRLIEVLEAKYKEQYPEAAK